MLTRPGLAGAGAVRQPVRPAQRRRARAVGRGRFRFVYECADGHVSVTFLPGVLVGPFTNRLLSWVHEQGDLTDELAAARLGATSSRAASSTELADIVQRTSVCCAPRPWLVAKADLFGMAQRDKLLRRAGRHPRRRARPTSTTGTGDSGTRSRVDGADVAGPLPRAVGPRRSPRPAPPRARAAPRRAHRGRVRPSPPRPPRVPAEPHPPTAAAARGRHGRRPHLGLRRSVRHPDARLLRGRR